VINRIAVDLMENHPLLIDRVEIGQSTRMSTTNPNFIGAKTVADLVRAVNIGVSGRIGKRVEDELTRNMPTAVAKVVAFLDVLVAGSPELQHLVDEEIEPVELRAENSPERSMIASATMLRALAGAYHDLTKPPVSQGDPMALKRSEVEVFFSKLAPKLRESDTELDEGKHGILGQQIWKARVDSVRCFHDAALPPGDCLEMGRGGPPPADPQAPGPRSRSLGVFGLSLSLLLRESLSWILWDS
jgi:hypothetical protein